MKWTRLAVYVYIVLYFVLALLQHYWHWAVFVMVFV